MEHIRAHDAVELTPMLGRTPEDEAEVERRIVIYSERAAKRLPLFVLPKRKLLSSIEAHGMAGDSTMDLG
jgi:hypothetical protein